MKKGIYIILILVSVSTTAFTATPGTTGFQFLKSQMGARPAAMGGAFLAIPGDIHDIHYNPAGLAVFQGRAGSFTYLKHLLDFNSGFIGYVEPEVGPGNLAFGLFYMDYGQFTKTGEDGEELGDFGANSIVFTTAYALSPIENLLTGISLKYIRATIDNYATDAVALDVGVMYRFPQQQLTFAAGIANLGKAMTPFIEYEEDLPFLMRVGVAKHLEHLPLLLSFNLYKYSDEVLHGALGLEFTLTENAYLRLGYDNSGLDLRVDASGDRFAGASIGLGLNWRKINFDYAFSSMGELGSLNRFTITSQL
ncbi:PorV/PorQ family protein [candidate division KSB1 bacterium]|nr:PorV/PorQ family protein [candidate division KSB1 bacterium]